MTSTWTSNTAAVLLVALLIGGCALPQADSTRQRLYAIDRQFGAVVKTATKLKRAGKLSRDQAETLDRLIQSGNETLSAAHAAVRIEDAETVQDKIDHVKTLIVRINSIIQEAKDE